MMFYLSIYLSMQISMCFRIRANIKMGVVAIEKGTFGSPSTTVANLYIYMYIN